MQSLCPHCGTLNPVQNLYCGSCGESMVGAELVKESQKSSAARPADSRESSGETRKSNKKPRKNTVPMIIGACVVVAIILAVVFLVARGGLVERLTGYGSRSDADLQATSVASSVETQVAIDLAVAATLTAAAPTVPPTFTASPVPTLTDTPTQTPTVSPTPMTPTPTPVPTDTRVNALGGDPLDYIPSSAEMPDGFTVATSESKPLGDDTTYPAYALVYSRGVGLALEIVGYTVILIPNEETTQQAYKSLLLSVAQGDKVSVNVAGADEYISFADSESPVVTTFLRYENAIGIVFVGGVGLDSLEYYVSLLMNEFRP